MEIVPVAELKIGMFIVEPDCPWTEFNFALQGFVISTPEQIDTFASKCRFVQIDRSRSILDQYAASQRVNPAHQLRAATLAAEAPPLARRGPPGRPLQATAPAEQRRRLLNFLQRQQDDHEAIALGREIVHIEPRYEALQHALQQTFQRAKAEQGCDLGQLREGVGDLAGSLRRNPDALMWLLRLKTVDDYSFDHAMEVAVHALLLGNHLGWRGTPLLELGVAALLQDVGKTQIPAAILNKREALTAEEMLQIRAHVAASLELLLRQADFPTDILQAIARHHERWDGSGYPRGLRFEEIGLNAEILGLADSFCAMLSDRPYRLATGHQQALEILFGLRGKKFNPVLMEQFAQCVGLYPVGTLVELSNGEVGVVLLQNRVQRARPRVLILLDADKTVLRSYRLRDLRTAECDHLRIQKALPRGAYDLSQHDYFLA